jgi:hypothetical protein
MVFKMEFSSVFKNSGEVLEQPNINPINHCVVVIKATFLKWRFTKELTFVADNAHWAAATTKVKLLLNLQ